MLTTPLATTTTSPAAPRADGRSRLEHATVREILMGAQDNLTNVLAVMLGVSIGSGRADLVALAGLSAAVAEAVSMGGVLYSSTRAESALDARDDAVASAQPARAGLAPLASGLTCFAAALLGGLIPLAPFAILPLPTAVVTAMAVSIAALFVLGALTGRISGTTPWRDGVRLVLVAGLAATAAAIIGATLAVD